MATRKKRRVQFHESARKDIERLAKVDRPLARIAYTMLRGIEAGTINGEPLRQLPKFGDLSDCFKVYFGYGNPPTHRIVYRLISEHIIEIIDVLAIESRDDAYVYLLAAERLGRLPKESQPQYESVHQRIIAKRSKQNKKR